ncbi:hypothetical protein EDEG_01044 [Edhazardia aedis USNM 41457]|uniref:Uncharacterized protein n=1 Tax=Edhazardia aedis (strain USNM 41457) TaxID=1003232 RepID=J9DB85_EDHAE|nr:hypothetical protein EDEG_01044 [Edhazardia aedis USNM 41457]|eukprot:EJW04754.1 hypothetical protein EDEG_01044 [Edhazardia aedis USNM 41457]
MSDDQIEKKKSNADPQMFKDYLMKYGSKIPNILKDDCEKYFATFEDDYELVFEEDGTLNNIKFNDIIEIDEVDELAEDEKVEEMDSVYESSEDIDLNKGKDDFSEKCDNLNAEKQDTEKSMRDVCENEKLDKDDENTKKLHGEYEIFDNDKSVEKIVAEIDNLKIEKKTVENMESSSTDDENDKKHAFQIPENFVPPKIEPQLDLTFVPDVFQLQSFYCLSNNCSLLVTAHTSAGKTTIVDYAIFLASLNNTKLVYTSPIKALSNQKYYEFRKHKPGLLTGDITLNKESDVLIMTTEILRNMLYSRNTILSNLQYVVFDEVHYINNRDRGVVWEECIILIPKNVTIILLSACIPNALEFGEWVGRIRNCEIFVISTGKRPVPLVYFILKDGEIKPVYNNTALESKEMPNIKIESAIKSKPADSPKNQESIKGHSKHISNILKLLKSSTAAQNKNNHTKPAKLQQKKPNSIKIIVDHILKQKLIPSIFFCFSRKKCHITAKNINQPYLAQKEVVEVDEIITKKLYSKLDHKNKKLPQVVELVSLLKNGIGIHHSGLLPILKELVEILFSKNLIKILIATETFSMGVNFPAKSVFFLSLYKRDSITSRMLNPGEFLQMSGRAGRRNVDTKGVVIVNLDTNEKTTANDVLNLIKGKTHINSKFKTSFSMILQLFRCNMKVEDMLRKSFDAESSEKYAYKFAKSLFKLENIYSDFKSFLVKNFNELEKELNDRKKIKELDKKNINEKTILSPLKNSKIKESSENVCGSEKTKFLESKMYVDNCKFCKNIETYIKSLRNYYKMNNSLVKCFFSTNKNFKNLFVVTNDLTVYKVDEVKNKSVKGKILYAGFNLKNIFSKKNNFVFFEIRELLDNFLFFPHVAINNINNIAENVFDLELNTTLPGFCHQPEIYINLQNHLHDDKQFDIFRILQNDQNTYKQQNLPQNKTLTESNKIFNIQTEKIFLLILDGKLITDYNLQDYNNIIMNKKTTELLNQINQNKCLICPDLNLHYLQKLTKILVEERIKTLKHTLDPKSLATFQEYIDKINFLRKLEYIDLNNIILFKGRIACEIKSVDCIFITEAVMSNSFIDFSFAELASFFSGFITNENDPKYDESKIETFKKLQDIKNVDDTKYLYKGNKNLDKDYNKMVVIEQKQNTLSQKLSNQKNTINGNIDNYKLNEEHILNLRTKISNTIHNIYEKIASYTNNISNSKFKFNEILILDAYTLNYCDGYIEAIYKWCLGASLLEITSTTFVAEGTLIRNIIRIDEFCKEMRNVAVFVNDMILLNKIESIISVMKRDIVHCPSLYFDE